MLGNVHDTEDAVQAVFVVLAQKADRLQREGSLGGWLHTVTRHVAMQALACRASHVRREEELAMWRETAIEESAPDVDTSAVLRCLDQELAGLSAVLRQAVVLRYLQGNSEKAAAELAGCPLGTLSWRASKGLAKLRQRLSKRGVALGGVALAGLLTSEASAAVPETLLPSILAVVKSAAATGAAATTATSTAAMLAKGAMKIMFWNSVKTAAMVVVSVGVVGVGGVAAVQAVAKKEAVTPVAAAPSEETDPKSTPVDWISKLSLEKIEVVPFFLRFKSVSVMPGGERKFQINVIRGNRTETYFLNLGEAVEGWKLAKFEEKSEMTPRAGIGEKSAVDISELTLTRDKKSVVLVKNVDKLWEDCKATLRFSVDESTFSLKLNDVFELRGNKYRLASVNKVDRENLESVDIERVEDGKIVNVRRKLAKNEALNK